MAGSFNGQPNTSPFTFNFSGMYCAGDRCSQDYEASFDTWAGYANWATGIAAEPQNQPGYEAWFNQGLNDIISVLKQRGAKDQQIEDFKLINPDANSVSLEGGHFDFHNSLNGEPIFRFGCPHNRCNDGLDFSHISNTDDTFHLDTGNPFDFPVGTFQHLVDVVGGGFMDFIPHF